MDDILTLERLTLATSPALREETYDGWVLRASGTDTRRANSVTQLEHGSAPLGEKVAWCEAWYQRAAQPAIFRLTSALSPPGLDGNLDARGYASEGASHIMTATLNPVLPAQGMATDSVVSRTAAEGIADLHSLKGSPTSLAQRDLERQAQWPHAEIYLAVMREGRVVACGLGRCHNGVLGIFNMRTAVEERGKGYASRLVTALLAWGVAKQSGRAFLQVEQSNAPALALYRRFGFERHYDYWYRVQPAVRK